MTRRIVSYGRRARALAPAVARTFRRHVLAAAPTVVAVVAIVVVVAVAADAQTVSDKPLEEVMHSGRDWIITKIVPFAGAGILAWNALQTKTGHREGFGNLAKGFVALLIGLGAAGVVSSAASLVQ